MRPAVLLAALGLLRSASCQRAEGSAAAPALRGGAPWWMSQAPPQLSQQAPLSGPADPWWTIWYPEAGAFRAHWERNLTEMQARVNASIACNDSDPVWKEAADLAVAAAMETLPGRFFTLLCRKGMQAEYTIMACSAGTFGDVTFHGIPADAYYCGSTKSGINWTRSWWGNRTPPVMRICGARPGSAYTATGFCGRWTTRELVLGTYLAMPRWHTDAAMVNFPSLRCLLGLGNCDIGYCEGCPGRCGPQ